MTSKLYSNLIIGAFLLILLAAILLGCKGDGHKELTRYDVEKVKTGMSKAQIEVLLGEPNSVLFDNGSTRYDYRYDGSGLVSRDMRITFINDTVTTFTSY